MTGATLNEDWIKTLTWDLPETLPALLDTLGVGTTPPAAQRAALRAFTESPAWLAVPHDLETEANDFLGQETRAATPLDRLRGNA